MIEDQIRKAQKTLQYCYQDFLMWLLEYCKENKIPVWNDMGFVGHLERTAVAVEENIKLLEGKSPELQQSKDIFKVPMMHQNPF